MLEVIIIGSIKVIAVVSVLMGGCAYATYLERKLVAFMQHRIGPLYAGPWGLLQPIADSVKLMFKEDVVPDKVERVAFTLAPMLGFIPALLVFAVVPFSSNFTMFGYEIKGVISDLNIGVLFVFAIVSLGAYGLILAGWSSGSKYSLLGGIRGTAQMVSYELSYGLSIVGVIIIGSTLSMTELVEQQSSILDWYIWKQPLGFLLYITCAVAETNRCPFDMPEAEGELVAGYHTEYSSMRFATFFVSEYAYMIAVSAVATTLFFGGWQGPLLPPIVWFCIKVFAFMVLYIWLRATLPRFRYDQLMGFGWKVLFPLAIINTMATGFWVIWMDGIN
ncbi:MAG: NADH-quinone oxidoreductase subunit NuoH [Candidatus Zixiibacteriota bacterium]|nr:MAG: NADH-quinone oxidoreductase subunit NuoH [candidate division Zixibacteria bacterium]